MLHSRYLPKQLHNVSYLLCNWPIQVLQCASNNHDRTCKLANAMNSLWVAKRNHKVLTQIVQAITKIFCNQEKVIAMQSTNLQEQSRVLPWIIWAIAKVSTISKLQLQCSLQSLQKSNHDEHCNPLRVIATILQIIPNDCNVHELHEHHEITDAIATCTQTCEAQAGQTSSNHHGFKEA